MGESVIQDQSTLKENKDKFTILKNLNCMTKNYKSKIQNLPYITHKGKFRVESKYKLLTKHLKA